jgi:cytoskeletal protein RodZ|tara:strand:+ start:914 stop:1873 length:960 start_codon:yes stop_codon:yes gene_type:complete
MVENFGSYLKRERESRGVPLEEISGATKIHIRFLKALEENSFDQLPGEVFIKGYIRSYANIIGSDVEEMLNIYEESVGLKNQENLPQEKPSFNTQPKTLLAYGLLILVVTCLLFGVGFLIKNGMGDSSGKSEEKKGPLLKMQAKGANQQPSISSSSNLSGKQLMEENINTQEADSARLGIPAQELSIPINPSAQPARKEDVDEKKASSPQESVALTTQAPSGLLPDLDPQNPAGMEKLLKLSIRVKEISWFNMTIDNFREEDFILPAGTAKTFWGNETIRLTVGNKTGVELFLNGKALVLPESKDTVVKDFFINSKLVE